jgi:heme exporter protein D
MLSSPHAAFIVAAFAIAAAVMVGLVLWIVIDHIQLKRTLRLLEERGLLRQTGREAS